MKKLTFKFCKQSLIALVVSLSFSCSSLAEPFNLGILKRELVVYHDSGLYQKELSCVLSQARNYILQQAKINQRLGNKRKLAIVLDIDETSLSNYSQIFKHRFNLDHLIEWKILSAADAPAIQPTLSLYNSAQCHGIKVFFVTGRPRLLLKVTKANLLRAGYSHWAGLYLRPDDYRKPSIIPFKSQARKSITDQGYTIVATIGDQYSDLKGGYAQKCFKLPNPFYYRP